MLPISILRAPRRPRRLRLTSGRSRVALLLLALLGATFITTACGTSAAAEQPSLSSPVDLADDDVGTVEVIDVLDGPVISGTLAAAAYSVVRAETEGAIASTLVDAGSHVSRGTPLARIDDRTQRAAHASALVALRSAQGAMASASRRVSRLEVLLAAGAVSAEEVEDARQQVAVAESSAEAERSRLAELAADLSHAVVRSPIAGIVNTRSVSTGEAVQPGRVLFEVLDPSSMRLEAAVPAAMIGTIRVGSPVRFTVTGYPGRTFTGRLDRISPAADAATRQIPVHVTIDNRDGRLVAGLYAEGRIAAAERRVLVVPALAVSGSGAQATVLRVAAGRLSKVGVETGARDADRGTVEIVFGLARGDTVLVGAPNGIAAGSAVRVTAPASAPNTH